VVVIVRLRFSVRLWIGICIIVSASSRCFVGSF